jgi:hypothetical protein
MCGCLLARLEDFFTRFFFWRLNGRSGTEIFFLAFERSLGTEIFFIGGRRLKKKEVLASLGDLFWAFLCIGSLKKNPPNLQKKTQKKLGPWAGERPLRN